MAGIDLGEWAESLFSTLCAEQGVTRNRSDQDRTGWDFLVEFPPRAIAGLSADLQPVGRSARVQIKATAGMKTSVSLKLSNALRFAKEPEACFIILYQRDAGGGVRIYARHVWTDLISAVLRRARATDGVADLHRLRFSVVFRDEDDHTGDLLAWMQREIENVGGLYAAVKHAVVSAAGLEDGGVRGTLQFAVEDWPAIVDHQLGLRPDAPIKNITMTERRFGIDAPMFTLQPDFASMRPNPLPCRVRVRGRDGRDVWLDGESLAPSFRDMPREHFRIRVQAAFMDIVTDGRTSATAKLSWEMTDQRPLEGLQAVVGVARHALAGMLDFQVRFKGQPAFGFEAGMDARGYETAVSLSPGLDILERVAGRDAPDDLTLSLADIRAAWTEVRQLHRLAASSDLTLNIVSSGPWGDTAEIQSLWAYGYADVGGWRFMSIASRPVLDVEVEGAAARIRCGAPQLIESMVHEARERAGLDELKRWFDAAVEDAGPGALTMCGGDWRMMTEGLEEAA